MGASRAKFRKRSAVFTIGAVGLAAGMGGIAYAAIPGGNGFITGCYSNKTGAVRIINSEAGAKCAAKTAFNPGETQIQWNQTGPQGPAGPTGIVTTGTFIGQVQPIPGSTSAFVFAGPTATVTTTATQRLMGAGSAAMGLAGGAAPQFAGTSLCYQSLGGGSVNNFNGSGFLYNQFFTNDRRSYAATASTVPGAGSWKVGFCVLNNSGAASISNNDFVSGWVLVTN